MILTTDFGQLQSPYSGEGIELYMRRLMEQGFSYEELLKSVWAGDATASDHTVDASVTRILKRLGSYAPHLVNRAGFGYCFEE